MSTQTKRKILNISLPNQLYAEVEKLAKRETKTKAEFTREVLRQYIESQRRWREIRKWGRATAKKLGIKSERDIERIIDEFEAEYEKEISSK